MSSCSRSTLRPRYFVAVCSAGTRNASVERQMHIYGWRSGEIIVLLLLALKGYEPATRQLLPTSPRRSGPLRSWSQTFHGSTRPTPVPWKS